MGASDGATVEALASSLGLSQADLQRLQHFIDEEPVLRTQHAPEIFCEVANELHRSIWFLLSGDTQLIETYRGTRAGGSLADIIFNILFCKVLERRDRSTSGQHVPMVPWSGTRSPWCRSSGDGGACRLTEVSDVVYADDLASFLDRRHIAPSRFEEISLVRISVLPENRGVAFAFSWNFISAALDAFGCFARAFAYAFAHDLAPAVPGVGKKALGPAPPEMLPELTAELDALVPADADAIFDVVSRCIAPLPVLRCTIETWCRTLPPGVLRSAAEDVLLVFSPEHLCTRISGRKACSSPASPDFVPLPDLPVIVCGPLVSHWVEGVNAGHLAVTTIAFSDVAAWSWRQAAPPASPSLGPLLGLRRCSLLLPAACEFCANCQSGSTASSLRLARSCSWPRQDGRFGFVSLSRRRLWNRYPTGLLPWPKSWHLAPSLRQSGDNIGDNSLQ
ncbi:unnamed protein product [Symbiodinium microadriaticum]|nr:unnamed protein product [Symbiodinium microadriaticum]